MEAGEVVQLMKLNDFTQFKNQDVLTIIKGCHEKTRSTFFSEMPEKLQMLIKRG